MDEAMQWYFFLGRNFAGQVDQQQRRPELFPKQMVARWSRFLDETSQSRAGFERLGCRKCQKMAACSGNPSIIEKQEESNPIRF